MSISDIGTKLTESRIELHLYNLEAKTVTPSWLHDHLGLRVDEQWDALQWSANESLLLALYDAKREEWNGKIPRVFGDGTTELIEMEEGSGLTVEERIDRLTEGRSNLGDAFARWALPPLDFQVPFSGTLLGQMCGLVKGEAASCATVTVRKFEYPHAAVTELLSRVDTLQALVVAREARWKAAAESLVACRRVSNLLRLVARGWHVSTTTNAKENATAVDDFRLMLAEKQEEVVADLLGGDEDPAADAVLEMLGDGDLLSAAEILAFDPLAVSADEAEELATAIRHACEVLSRSTGAERLLRDHAWPAIADACRAPPYAFDRIVADMENDALRVQLQTGWETTHAEIQRSLGEPQGDSVLKKLGTAGKYYRLGPSIVGSAVSEGVLMKLWESIDGSASWRGNRLAGLLLRFVISSGVPDNNNARLMFAGRLDFKKVLDELDKLPKTKTPEALQARADAFSKLRLKDQLARTQGTVGLGLLASIAILWSAAVDEEQIAVQRGFAIAAGISGVAESVGHMAIYIKAYQGQNEVLGLTKMVADGLGRMYILFAAIAAGAAFLEKRKVSDGLSFTGGALRVSGWLVTLYATPVAASEAEAAAVALQRVGARLLAGWLGLVGSVVGGIGLAWAVLPALTIPDQGIEKILYPYFEKVIEPGGPFAAHAQLLRSQLTKNRRCFATHFNAIRMPTMPGGYDVAGKPGRWENDEAPTFHAAHMLGFMAGEVATLFAVPEQDVIAAGVAESMRGSRRPGTR